jgi:hypothetical protein
LRVFRLEISIYNVYITDQFLNYFCSGEGRGGGFAVEETVNSKEENP